MSNDISIRPVKQSDATELLHLYTPYILHTALTPESKVPFVAEFEARIRQIAGFYPYLICIYNKKIAGFAHAGQYRHASGHQWSVETSIYLAQDVQGKGIAHRLYDTLLPILKLQDFVNVFAGIILPNERSISFHRKFNFSEAGIFKNGIYKSGEWHDVQWMQLALKDHVADPPLPKSIQSVMKANSFREIMDHANQFKE